MKFLSLVLLALSFTSFADTIDYAEVRVNTGQPTNVIELLTEKTKTIYRTVTVNAMCTRTEYRYQCRTVQGQCRTVCRNGQCRRVCSQPRRVCQNYPVRVNYPCQRQERRQFEVLDHYVNTNVTLNYDFGNNDVADTVNLTANGNSLTANSNNKNHAVYLISKNISSSMQGNTLYKDVIIDLKYVDAKSLNNVVASGIKNVKLNSGILSFELNRDFNFKDFTQTIKLYRDKRVGSSIFLGEKELRRNDLLDVQVNGNIKIMTLDLRTVINSLPQRLRVKLDASFNTLNYDMLNRDSLELSTKANWLFY